MSTTEPNRPSHSRVAQLLAPLTVATVSRLRSGDRLPSLDLMLHIRELLVWDIDAQATAKKEGTYAAEFNRRLAAWADRNPEAT